MADSTTWVLVGIGIGVAVGVGAAVLLERQHGGPPDGISVLDVHRNENGRITSIETVRSGVGVGAAAALEAP